MPAKPSLLSRAIGVCVFSRSENCANTVLRYSVLPYWHDSILKDEAKDYASCGLTVSTTRCLFFERHHRLTDVPQLRREQRCPNVKSKPCGKRRVFA